MQANLINPSETRKTIFWFTLFSIVVAHDIAVTEFRAESDDTFDAVGNGRSRTFRRITGRMSVSFRKNKSNFNRRYYPCAPEIAVADHRDDPDYTDPPKENFYNRKNRECDVGNNLDVKEHYFVDGKLIKDNKNFENWKTKSLRRLIFLIT
jgi:hypothetical protein